VLYSADVWAVNNRGPAYLKEGKRKKARQDFEAALLTEPAFEPARKIVEPLRAGASEPRVCASSNLKLNET
jgi:hypothetical protein